VPGGIDEAGVLSIERLRDDLSSFHADLKTRYRSERRQVTSDELTTRAARLAETGMVEIVGRTELSAAVSRDDIARLSIQFQRLLLFSERSTTRSKYDAEIKALLRDYRARLVIPLKQYVRNNPRPVAGATVAQTPFDSTAFVGHSFAPADSRVVEFVVNTLTAAGIAIVTGEKPTTDRLSEKIQRRIEAQGIFVGIFSRRDKTPGKDEWNTSTWVIEEKAYAFALKKKLILIKENGVVSIGGIQGDREYLEFSRSQLHDLGPRLLGLFIVSPMGFRS